MSRRLSNLTLDNLDELPRQCRACVFWELEAPAAQRAIENGTSELEKEAWVSDTLLEWGCCGQLVHVDGDLGGYVLYAPPAYVPRSTGFPTSPVAADAVLLTAARVLPAHRGGGLGRMLVQGMVRDLSRRGIRAVEAFGQAHPAPGADSCLVPSGFLLAVGFKTVRPHPRTPRLRLDVKSTASWREDVESALERLRGLIKVPTLAPR